MSTQSSWQNAIDTGRVTDRRAVRYASIDEVLADVQRLAEAERAARIERIGNWTLGQALGHLAAWIGYSFDGYPLAPPPWPIRFIVRLRKNAYIHNKLPAGVRIPRVPGGTTATEPLQLDEGLERYGAALERLRVETPQEPNPLFGPLTHDEWVALQLRHAELHLSFFRAGETANQATA